jgi:hypothetical protein
MFNAKTKAFIDALKCPICQDKIDLHDYQQLNNKFASNQNAFNFNCMKEVSHYQMWFEHWKNSNCISDDQLWIKIDDEKYCISQEYDIGRTFISIYNKEKKNKKTKYFNSILFDWQKMDQEKIAARLKTILIFH